MRATADTTSIYLVCFHSGKPKDLTGSSGQYCKVDSAILQDEWPYDNGDDPSFYVARKGGRLTWGVCRQDLRNAIARGSIVVFFSFTPLVNDKTLYRLCAVATVDDKVDHRAIHRDRRLSPFRRLYINGLIIPQADGWRYDERPCGTTTGCGEWPIIAESRRQSSIRNMRRFVTRRTFPILRSKAVTSGLPTTMSSSPTNPVVVSSRHVRLRSPRHGKVSTRSGPTLSSGK